MTTNSSVISVANIIKKYGKRTVVKGISMELKQGEIVGLLGPNGAGKTTTFYMISGLIRPNGGQIFIDDKEISKLPMYKRSRLGLAYLPQEASVFRKLSVEDNLYAIMQLIGYPKKDQQRRCEELLEDLHITHIAKNMGYNLSGGERRRCEIARTLVSNPKFILLDEPFAGVDPIAVEDIQSIITKLQQKNLGVLITDHNVQETLKITERSYLLFDGEILKEGSPQQLAEDEDVRRKYLGAKFRL
ncbi:MAG: LPS export ABC transporter ATP-binding protein [Calditrichaeota bacterium]|nr:LPS export ABC transporter ATP-binding protein [Calditrichota bacterium]